MNWLVVVLSLLILQVLISLFIADLKATGDFDFLFEEKP